MEPLVTLELGWKIEHVSNEPETWARLPKDHNWKSGSSAAHDMAPLRKELVRLSAEVRGRTENLEPGLGDKITCYAQTFQPVKDSQIRYSLETEIESRVWPSRHGLDAKTHPGHCQVSQVLQVITKL